jgi:hypothetical protein
MKNILGVPLCFLALLCALFFVACEDKVRVTIKVKTKEADAAVDAAKACCQAETSTKTVVP